MIKKKNNSNGRY